MPISRSCAECGVRQPDQLINEKLGCRVAVLDAVGARKPLGALMATSVVLSEDRF
jgi:hypothetical protein